MAIEDIKKEIEQIKEKISFNNKKKELNKLGEQAQKPDFWKNEKQAKEISQRMSYLKNEIEQIEILEKDIETENLGAQEKKNIEEKIQRFFLSGKYDKKSAILTFQAGAGGRDAEDWTALLLRMYQRWAERKNFQTKILQRKFGEGGGPEGRIGLKEASIKIKGKFVYGFLRRENGTHRLVRISPFSAKKLRHTSFARVEVLPDIEDAESAEVKIRQEDLKIETFRASGPGGQYVNKRESAVRITHIPTGLRTACQTERLQGLNRKIAMEILLAKILARTNKEKEDELKEIKGVRVSPDFGQQIRTYVLHPYKLVKDLRTKVETSAVEEVLDGEIDDFIQAEIRIISDK